MTHDEANQIITEKMGGCWHIVHEERVRGYGVNVCSCGEQWDWKDIGCKNPDFFTTHQCFNVLWPYMRDDSKHPGWTWIQFVRWYAAKNYDLDIYPNDHVEYILDYGFELIANYRDDNGIVMLSAEWLEEK